MSRGKWHSLRHGEQLTLSRVLPARFDVVADTNLPDASLSRLAHQIRQDLWRELQNLRGFSPVLQLSRNDGEVHIRAGGRVDGAVPKGIEDRISTVLNDPGNRRRWLNHAAHRRVRA